MTEYPASTLTLIKGKWYVSVTVPQDLRHLFKSSQIKRSTGTPDQRRAKQLQHVKTSQIYAEFDAAAKSEEASKTVEAMKLVQELFNIALEAQGEHPSDVRPYLNKNAIQTIEIIDRLADELIAGGSILSIIGEEYDHAVSIAWKYCHEANRKITDRFREPEDRHATILSGQELDLGLDGTEKLDIENHMSHILPKYISERPWTREKTKREFQVKIENFIDQVGDLRLDDIKKQHAYQFAKQLSTNGKANKTIRSYITAVKGLLDWSEQNGLIDQHPFTNLNLTNYGYKAQHYLPFSKSDLHKLFKQNLPAQERLLLSILITTGMRLDEAALLTWEQVKEKDDVRFFDLSKSLTKNMQSKREVAVPSSLRLPKPQSGRIFSYSVGIDGKSSGSASKALTPWIRKITRNPRKVAHSLRGTLKDFLRDNGTSKETNDFITGHVGSDVASSYGTGPSLVTKFNAVDAVEHPWLTEPTD